MIRLASIAALALTTACTTTNHNVPMPPERFRAERGTVITTFVPQGETDRVCGNGDMRVVVLGCARSFGIVMGDPCEYPDQSYAARLCHELAHYLKNWKDGER